METKPIFVRLHISILQSLDELKIFLDLCAFFAKIFMLRNYANGKRITWAGHALWARSHACSLQPILRSASKNQEPKDFNLNPEYLFPHHYATIKY